MSILTLSLIKTFNLEIINYGQKELNIKEVFETDYFSDYYTDYRLSIDDFFDSEKVFFKQFISENKSYLDVGCALGGFYSILNEKCSSYSYIGVDISEN